MATAGVYVHEDYTVGLICALPVELAATTAMLDEIHADLPTPLLDGNIYTLGRIRTHNVVISCCPPGTYGTTSAATMAIHMVSSFRAIRVGLVVGIGGGVPSIQADVRLGDVVVSMPDDRYGGVVQYDYGKTIEEGKLQYTSALNPPPGMLVTAIWNLRATHTTNCSQIPKYLSDMATKYPHMSNFTYPGRQHDQLFEAHYDHISPNSTCDHCDQRRIIPRPVRDSKEPEIHYGLIGSGNQVMKHGPTRDKIAHELGILCFEMEAAGLMDHFPCLVIRGICDYADSHMNKMWQRYAAATAAAYAKELLSITPTLLLTPMSAASTLPDLNGAVLFNAYSHHDYTIGLICALPLEVTAVTAMLDEIHANLPTPPSDGNTYILGKIGAHNVVISCCPPGTYGTTSAATVAAWMLSSFRSIWLGLMVGIGGGVPSIQADVRLGDVVVSTPKHQYGGVVQYDYGKTIDQGKFSYSGTLSKPPRVLLKAVAKLQADYLLNGSRLSTYLSEMATKPHMSSFTYPGREHDQLFEAHYGHISPNSTCDHCDQRRIIPRPVRDSEEPEIHYGLVGSGNQVMKHGPTRDKIAHELGILCFEMEAAGLMDHFPCLVIRGICDYADSHKNKRWQRYAAATAAAYAKNILAIVPHFAERKMLLL